MPGPEPNRLPEAGPTPAGRAVVRLPRHGRAFTLIELMLVVAIVATLAVIGNVAYSAYVERARVSKTQVEMRSLESRIERYKFDEGEYPETLDGVGGAPLDPWGNPYGYLRIADAVPGDVRKDKNLVPLNSDYDLYSSGPDGDSKPPLTAAASRDDIVRANNGSFIGPAADY